MRFVAGIEPIRGYQLERPLGRGSYGEVWRATGPGGMPVALKVVDLSSNTSIRELRALNCLRTVRHPHLLPVTAFWFLDAHGEALQLPPNWYEEGSDEDGRPFGLEQAQTLVIAMVLADASLYLRLQACLAEGRGGIPVMELLKYMEGAAQGLDYLNAPIHDLGEGPVSILHRDIKPHNILLQGGTAVICDFGVARALQSISLKASAMIGTPIYIAPECIKDLRPHVNSDQYSLAITYYHLRTGRIPFPSDSNRAAIIFSHLEGKLVLDHLPEAERAVIARATQLDPRQRFGSCGELVQALAAAGRHANEIAPPSAIEGTFSTLGVASEAATIGSTARESQIQDVPSLSSTRDDTRKRRWTIAAIATSTIIALATTLWMPRSRTAPADGTDQQTPHASQDSQDTEVTEQPTEPPLRITNSVGMQLVRIPAGDYMMGSPTDEPGRRQDEHQHHVSIATPFYMSVTEVTRQQWLAVVGTKPWQTRTESAPDARANNSTDLPASNVSWNAAQQFVTALSEKEDRRYRLPTEAEWEYACRAGSSTAYHFGDDVLALHDVAWYQQNTRRTGAPFPHPVAEKSPNAWGLHDMHGNVWEWCEDAYPLSTDESEADEDPGNAQLRAARVFRGGSWYSPADGCRAATRNKNSPDAALPFLGLRVVAEDT